MSNLVKTVSEPSPTRYRAFKVIRSNIEIAIIPPWIDRLRSNLAESFITSQARLKVKGQGYWVKRKGHNVK